MPYKIAQVGYGRLGRDQVAYLMPVSNFQLVGVVDKSKAAYADFQSKYFKLDIPVYENIHDLLENEDVDVITISTTAPSHASLAEEIVKSGFSGGILVEKPISNCLACADALRKVICDSSWRGRIAVDYQRRCSPLYGKIATILREGILGKINRIVVNKPGQKLSMNCSHYLDLAIFYINDQPETVFADFEELAKITKKGSHRGTTEMDPFCELTVTFKNGSMVYLNTKTVHDTDNIVIFCENGQIEIDAKETVAFVRGENNNETIRFERDIFQWYLTTLEDLLSPAAKCAVCSIDEAIISLEIIVAAFVSNETSAPVTFPLGKKARSNVLRIM